MKSSALFFVLATFCVLSTNGYLEYSIDSYSRDVFPPTSDKYELVHDLSSKDGGYYYAYCKQIEDVNKIIHVICEVTEEIPVSHGAYKKKTCIVDDQATNLTSVRFLKSWGDHKALLVAYHENKLNLHQINMTTCAQRTEHLVNNVTSFQVYITNDNEFDVFWTSGDTNNGDLAGHILRNTYKLNGEKFENSQFTHQPNDGNLYDTWKVLLLSSTNSYHWERRTNNQEVLSSVNSYNKTDLWFGSEDFDRFVTSNLHGELGVCELTKEKGAIKCMRYNQETKSTANLTLNRDDLMRGHKTENARLYNLEGGKLVMVFVETRSIRSFTSVVVHPDGHFDHPLEVAFENPGFTCLSGVDPTNKNYLPPRVNVVEQGDQFCFQFMCSDNPTTNPSLKYRLKCMSKGLIDKAPEKTKTSGVSASSSASIFLVSSIALFISRFFN